MRQALEVLLRIRGDASGGLAALRNVQGKLRGFGAALRGITGTAKGVGRSFMSVLARPAVSAARLMRSSFSLVHKTTSSLLTGLAKLGLGIFAIKQLGQAAVGLGRALLAPNASMEQTRIAFVGLLKDGKRADAFLRDLQAFSARTPFEFEGLAESSRRLLAMGFAAEEILPMMEAIGDAVAGLGGGAAEVDRVTMALGQMRAKGKVSAEEMMQLAELGIPAWQMLADSMGLTTAEVMKLSEKGLIPADKAIDALITGMNTAFGGQMAKQSQTFNGLLSTLKDNARLALMAFTGPLFEQAKGGLQVLGDLVASPRFQAFAKTMGERVGRALQTVIGYAGSLYEIIRMLVTGDFRGGIFDLAEDDPWIVALLGARDAVISLYGWAKDKLAAGWRVFTDFWSATLKPALSDLWTWFKTTIPAAWQATVDFWNTTLKPALSALHDWLKVRITAAIDDAKKKIDDLKPLWDELVKFLTDGLFPAFQTLYDWLWGKIPKANDETKTKTGDMKGGWETFVTWTNDTLIPALEKIRKWLRDDLPAALDTFDQSVKDVQPALDATEKFLSEDLSLAFGTTYDWLMKKLPEGHDKSRRANKDLRSDWESFVKWLNGSYVPTLEDVGKALKIGVPVALAFLDRKLLESMAAWRLFKTIILGQIDGAIAGFETFVNSVRGAYNWIAQKVGAEQWTKPFVMGRVSPPRYVSTSDVVRSRGAGPSEFPQGQGDRISAMAGWVADFFRDIWAKGPRGMLDAAMRALGLGDLRLGGGLGSLAGRFVTKIKDLIVSYITGLFGTEASGPGTPISGGLRGAMMAMFRNVFPVGDGFYADRAGQLHGGIDLLAPGGSPFYALTSGRVISSGWHGIGGNAIVVQAPSGRRWYAGHFMGAPMARAGEYIRKGQWLATVGSTGWSSGPHVHFQVSDLAHRWIDPLLFFSRVAAFATGGIVNRPTFGLVGEAGPEAVLPLDRFIDALRRIMQSVVQQLNAVQEPMARAIVGMQMQMERTSARIAEALHVDATRRVQAGAGLQPIVQKNEVHIHAPPFADMTWMKWVEERFQDLMAEQEENLARELRNIQSRR